MPGRCRSDMHCSAASYVNSLLFSRRTSGPHAGSCSSRSRRQSSSAWSDFALAYMTWRRLASVVACLRILVYSLQCTAQARHRRGCVQPGQLEQLKGKGAERLLLRLQHVQLERRRAKASQHRLAGSRCFSLLERNGKSPLSRCCHTKLRQECPCSTPLPCMFAGRPALVQHPETSWQLICE